MLWVDHLATRYHLTMRRDLQLPRLRPQPDRRPVAAPRRDLRRRDRALLHRRHRSREPRRHRHVGSSNAWRIGAYGSSPGGFFDGLIDDVRVYNRALTPGEIHRQQPAVSARRRRRRTGPPPSRRARSSRPAARPSRPQLGRGDRQRRRDPLQRPSLRRPPASRRAPRTGSRSPPARPTPTTASPPAPTTTRSPPRTPPPTSAPPRTRRAPPSPDATPPSRRARSSRPDRSVRPRSAGARRPTTSASLATTSIAPPPPGFTPSTANRIAQPTGTSYTDNGLAAGTYYYKVTAEDAAANVGPASNEATATVTVGYHGADGLGHRARVRLDSDRGRRPSMRPRATTIGVAGVQFRIDGQNLGAEDTIAPYSIDWDSRGELNGVAHAQRNRARRGRQHDDSSAVTVTVE